MTDPIGMSRDGDYVSFTARKDHLERFEKILHKADLSKGLAESMIVAASMLTAVQAHMIATFGREVAQQLMGDYVAQMFKITRPM